MYVYRPGDSKSSSNHMLRLDADSSMPHSVAKLCTTNKPSGMSALSSASSPGNRQSSSLKETRSHAAARHADTVNWLDDPLAAKVANSDIKRTAASSASCGTRHSKKLLMRQRACRT